MVAQRTFQRGTVKELCETIVVEMEKKQIKTTLYQIRNSEGTEIERTPG